MEHWNQFVSSLGMGTPDWIPVVGFAFIILTLWSLFWKGLALWHSAHRNQPWWFVFLLVINTAGIAEIIYLFFVAKLKSQELFKH